MLKISGKEGADLKKMNKMPGNGRIIAPSILSADFGNIRSEITLLHEAGARWFHFDVMDGSFVPPITFGAELVKSVRNDTDAYFDVHLMVHNPERQITSFKEAGADMVTVHYETCPHLHYVVDTIHKHDMDAGVVINPGTPVSVLSDIVTSVDLVLIMSVNPGWGGQPFIKQTYTKLTELKQLLEYNQTQPLIQVDGGVKADNASRLSAAGAQVFVAGSSIYKSTDPSAAFHDLTAKVNRPITA